MRVGVIGVGAMGENHVRVYREMSHVTLAGIADVDEERVNLCATKYDVEGFTDYNDLLDQDLDAVSVAVPTTLHKRIALDVIRSHTNVLVEKPLTDTIENAQAIIEAAKKEDITLMVGHIERFNPAVMKMRELIEHNELGQVVSISTRRVGPFDPRVRDVGVILDLGVHDIDVIAYLYHATVSEVYAVAGNEIHPFEDHASILLRFKDNNAGVVEVNWLTPHKTRNFAVIGTAGVGYGDFLKQTVIIHDHDWIREAKVEQKEPLKIELESFIHTCEHGGEVATSGEDGKHALIVALAAIQSHKNKTAVRLPSIGDNNLRTNKLSIIDHHSIMGQGD